MFTKGNTIYAEAGHILKCDNITAFQTTYDPNKTYVEIKLNDNISIDDNFVTIDSIKIRNRKGYTYGQWKSEIIKKRYSNDDQIAILLNRGDDESDMIYNKMMEWREWATLVARKIVAINEK